MSAPLSIQDVIDTIVAAMSEVPLTETVDTVKTGDPSQPVAGVVTTFLATTAVITEAIRLGANLIITHEPTFYSHTDAVDWLQGDPVYGAKRRLVVNLGSVSNPLPLDLRASYAVLDADERGYRLEHRRVAYDHAAVIEAVRERRHPAGAYIIRFQRGEVVPAWRRGDSG